MLVYLLIIAIVNLGVGYLLGVSLAPQSIHPRDRKLALGRSSGNSDFTPTAPTTPTPAVAKAPHLSPDIAALEAIESLADVNCLADEPLELPAPSAMEELAFDVPQTAVAADAAGDAWVASAMHEFLGALETLGERVAELDERVRRSAEAPRAAEIEGCVGAMRDAGAEYFNQTQPATERFATQQPAPERNALCDQLQAALEVQAERVQSAVAGLNKLDLVDDLAGSCQRLLNTAGDLARDSDQLHTQIAELRQSLDTDRGAAPGDNLALGLDSQAPLPSRDAWEAQLAVLRGQDLDSRAPLLAGMIDIDHFSRLTDNAGGDVSQNVLTAVAQVISATASEQTLVAQVSGQQFALLFGGGEVSDAVAEVERMRENLEFAQLEHEGRPIQITASCAVAKIKPEDTPDQLFDRLLRTIRESKQAAHDHAALSADEVDPALALAELEVASDAIIG